MSSVSVRGLVPNDLNAVWRINQEGNEDIAKQEPLLTHFVSPAARGDFLDDIREDLNDDDHLHLVADKASNCVGWGHAYVVLEPDGLRVGYINALYVDRAARGTGAGSALLAALTEWIKKQSVDRVQLMTPSRASSRAFWAKHGFRPFTEMMVLEPA